MSESGYKQKVEKQQHLVQYKLHEHAHLYKCTNITIW